MRLAEGRATGRRATYLVKCFEKAVAGWQLKALVRGKVRFDHLNLVNAWQAMPTIDVTMPMVAEQDIVWTRATRTRLAFRRATR
jgi:hypothetical protein